MRNNNKEDFFMKKYDTKKLVLLALLAGLLVLMAFTPIGYLNIGLLSITFNMIPVAIGAIVLGPLGGTVLGLVFGITSFAQCFGISAFGTTLCGISPLLAIVVTIGSRALAGFLAGVVYKLLKKAPAPVGFAVTGLAGAVFNTLFFMTLLMVCFGSTEYIMSMRGEMSVLAFVAAFVGINAVVEAIVSTILTLAVSMGLKRARFIGADAEKSEAAA